MSSHAKRVLCNLEELHMAMLIGLTAYRRSGMGMLGSSPGEIFMSPVACLDFLFALTIFTIQGVVVWTLIG